MNLIAIILSVFLFLFANRDCLLKIIYLTVLQLTGGRGLAGFFPKNISEL